MLANSPLGCAITLSIYLDRYQFLISICSQKTSVLIQKKVKSIYASIDFDVKNVGFSLIQLLPKIRQKI